MQRQRKRRRQRQRECRPPRRAVRCAVARSEASAREPRLYQDGGDPSASGHDERTTEKRHGASDRRAGGVHAAGAGEEEGGDDATGMAWAAHHYATITTGTGCKGTVTGAPGHTIEDAVRAAAVAAKKANPAVKV